MRLLYLPLYTNKNLNGCSSYNIAKKFIRNAVNAGWFVHWVLPEVGRFYYSGEPAEIEKHPQVMVHRVSTIDDQYMQTGIVPVDYLYSMFSQHCGKYHVDAVLSEKPASAHYVRKLLQHPFTKPAKTSQDRILGKCSSLPVFIRDPFTKVAELHGISDVEELSQSTGYLLNFPVFPSQHDMNLAMAAAKKYLNFGQVRKMRDRAVVIPAGTAVDELKSLRSSVKKRDKFTLLIAERLKNGVMMDVLDAGDYVFKRGYNMDVVVSSQTPFNGRTLSNYPTLFEHAEKYPANPRDKYLPLAASCHATITMPETHSYPQGLMEQLYLGVIAILPDFPWVDALLPNYPFKVKRNMRAMVGMIEWVSENYEEALRRVAWVPQYIEDNYNSIMMTEKLLKHMEDTAVAEIRKGTTTGAFAELIAQIPVSEISEEDLLAYLTKQSQTSVSFNNVHRSASFANYRSQVFRLMRDAGWRDVCNGPYGYFVKEDAE